MNAYHIMIQVCNSTPIIWRKIEVSDELSFQQLHEAILVLFHWSQDRDAYFQVVNQTLHMEEKAHHSTSLPLSTYLQDAFTFTYVYGSDEEKWEVSLFASKVTNEQASLQLIDSDQEFPIYGIGGVAFYQSIKKEMVHVKESSSFHRLFKRFDYPFDDKEIAMHFTNIIKRNETITHHIHLTQFNHELKKCRGLLEERTIAAPLLIIVKFHEQAYPCFIDFLDDGIEVMVFEDQSGFARSIINSISEDPDLLFTNALTIDFLYEDSDATELYVHDKNNLCFVNKAGCLPSRPKDKEFVFLTKILKQLNKVLLNPTLPPITKHLMLVIEDDQILECPYEIDEEVCGIQLSHEEKKSLLKFPHTNEHIAINFTAVPGKQCEETKNLDIHLVAQGKRYAKDELINVESMSMMVEQLYHYFDELIHARCIPESISTNSINLAHILQPCCDDLQIDLQLFTPSEEYKEDLLAILANTLHLTSEELLLMDEFDKDVHKDSFLYKENISLAIPTVASKYLN